MEDRELDDGDFDYADVCAFRLIALFFYFHSRCSRFSLWRMQQVFTKADGLMMVKNQPHDEEISICDSEQHRVESESQDAPSPVDPGAGAMELGCRRGKMVEIQMETTG